MDIFDQLPSTFTQAVICSKTRQAICSRSGTNYLIELAPNYKDILVSRQMTDDDKVSEIFLNNSPKMHTDGGCIIIEFPPLKAVLAALLEFSDLSKVYNYFKDGCDDTRNDSTRRIYLKTALDKWTPETDAYARQQLLSGLFLPTTDAEKARRFCEKNGATKFAALLGELEEVQPYFPIVEKAFADIAPLVDEYAHNALVDNGFFAAAHLGLVHKDFTALDAIVENIFSDRRIRDSRLQPHSLEGFSRNLRPGALRSPMSPSLRHE